MILMTWLLLVHELPARPSNVRVKTWRRLQKLGALAVKDSVYVLPNNPQAREDLEWIKKEVESMKGQATLFAADHLETAENDQLVAAFRRARGQDYAVLRKEVGKLGRSGDRDGLLRAVGALREHWRQIATMDFYGAPGRDESAAALDALERRLEGGRKQAPAATGRLRPEEFRDRLWVTRPRPGVDRMSSAWLIRRFIDPRARFAFAEKPGVVKDGLPFDMYGVEFGHHGNSCTFEVLAQRFGLRIPAITWLGRIVHDVDLKDGRFGATEAETVARTVEGLRLAYTDNAELLEHGIVFFEALYRSYSGTATRSKRKPRV